MKIEIDKLCRRAKDITLGLLFPPVCPICDGTLPLFLDGECCEKCADTLVPIHQAKCYKCGKPLGSTDVEYCELCLTSDFSFTRGIGLYHYDDLSRQLMLNLKYHGRGDLAKFFANQIYRNYKDELESFDIDVVIPVPIHKNRYIQRGYNQAEKLAKCLAELMGKPCETEVLVRIKDTTAQKQLGKNSRLLNLFDAFSIDLDACKRVQTKGLLRNVLLVDDIFTSGSTIQCCTTHLLEAGFSKVYFVTVCT